MCNIVSVNLALYSYNVCEHIDAKSFKVSIVERNIDCNDL